MVHFYQHWYRVLSWDHLKPPHQKITKNLSITSSFVISIEQTIMKYKDMGTSVTNYNNGLFPKILMGPYKSKASTTMAPWHRYRSLRLQATTGPWPFSQPSRPSFRNTGGWAATLSVGKEKRHHVRTQCHPRKDKNTASALGWPEGWVHRLQVLDIP